MNILSRMFRRRSLKCKFILVKHLARFVKFSDNIRACRTNDKNLRFNLKVREFNANGESFFGCKYFVQMDFHEIIIKKLFELQIFILNIVRLIETKFFFVGSNY